LQREGKNEGFVEDKVLVNLLTENWNFGIIRIEHDIRGFIDKTSLNFISFVLRLLKNNKNYILMLNNFLTWYKNFINKKL
jgi:hypothetical protein